jgi:hypothetical protein
MLSGRHSLTQISGSHEYAIENEEHFLTYYTHGELLDRAG